jgi:hypothetical protein
MTLDPNMFTQQAISGKAVLPADAANGFYGPVCNILGATVPGTATGVTLVASALVHFDFTIPDAATTTYTVTTADKIEIVDVIVRKDGAGAGNTITVKNGAGTAVSDAIAAAVDKTITRAGTIDVATNTIAAGGSFQITATKAAGTMAGNVTVVARRL